MIENYDFSGWIIKYDRSNINGKFYKKDCLAINNNMIVPLLWNHQHNRVDQVLGYALLESRKDGVFAYCFLYDNDKKESIIQLIRDRGSVSLSPYITHVQTNKKYITHGIIREVSLVPERIDPDECYYPVMRCDI